MFKEDVLGNSDVIILSKIEWNWQRQLLHQLSFWLAQCARNVIFIENFPKRLPRFYELNRVLMRILYHGRPRAIKYQDSLIQKNNIFIITPFSFPPVNFIFNLLNRRFFFPVLIRRIKKDYNLNQTIIFCFLPTQASLDFIELFKPKLLIYYCVSNFIADPLSPKDIVQTEFRVLKEADMVVCDSDFLYQSKREIRDDIVQVLPAVDFALFNQSDNGMVTGPIKRVCYFGGINNIRIDFQIIDSIASDNIEVRLIGPIRDCIPELPKNVKIFGMVEYKNLPHYLKDCDCLILPYKVNEFTKGVIPAKLFECFATGKPVIATALPDLLLYRDVINIASTPKEFINIIKNINLYETKDKYEKRIKIAKEHSEDRQFNRLWEVMRFKALKKECDN